MLEVKAPDRPEVGFLTPKVFLAGSIESGLAEDWQKYVAESLSDYNVCIYNPRRDNWDTSWNQEDKRMEEQIIWELDKLDESDYIFMYFDPNTKSPISLLELGIHIHSLNFHGMKKLMVCCPDGFWRKSNVKVVCDRYGIKLFDNIGEAIRNLRNVLFV
jgi:hypothetical protein